MTSPRAGAPDSFTFSAVKAVITCGLLLTVVPFQPPQPPPTPAVGDVDAERRASHADASAPPAADERNALGKWLARKTDKLGAASLELGLYAATGTLVQAWGLTVVPATTAGFLVQFTTVITPTLAILSGQRVGTRTGAAIALAVVGTFLTAADGVLGGGGDLSAVALDGGAIEGRLAIIAAACCYSLTTLRLSVLAPGVLLRCTY